MSMTVLLFSVLAAGLAAGLIFVGPRNVIGLLRYGGQRHKGDLEVGDAAPDVPLVGLDDTTSRALASWIGPRPLVLIFGSFT